MVHPPCLVRRIIVSDKREIEMRNSFMGPLPLRIRAKTGGNFVEGEIYFVSTAAAFRSAVATSLGLSSPVCPSALAV